MDLLYILHAMHSMEDLGVNRMFVQHTTELEIMVTGDTKIRSGLNNITCPKLPLRG